MSYIINILFALLITTHISVVYVVDGDSCIRVTTTTEYKDMLWNNTTVNKELVASKWCDTSGNKAGA